MERCRTEIIATTVVASGKVFISKNDWVFNNLTYLPSPRDHWVGNPLATPGNHTIDGRLWRTDCDTPATGRNGCRSYIMARVVAVVGTNPIRHAWQSTWLFNNIVQFASGIPPITPPTPTALPTPSNPPTPTAPPTPTTCPGVPHPDGYRVLANGMPSPPADGQVPANSYHPQYIGNYIRNVLKDSRTTRTQKKCLATLAGNHLIGGSTTRVIDGATSRWFPYGYTFRANPAVPALRAPWHSGIAQANSLTLSILMADVTGDHAWIRYGREIFESFLVSTEDGGFASREKGFLWFELYPTTPGTSVINGQFQAISGVAQWGQKMDEPRATALVDEALSGLDTLLTASEVEVEGGLMSSYELLRGYSAAPLRLVGAADFRLDDSLLNGEPQDIARVSSYSPPARNVLLNSAMTATSNGLPTHWSLLGSRSTVSAHNGGVRIVTNGVSWQGVTQTVASGTFQPGEQLNLRARSRLTLPAGAAGTSPKVMVRQWCSGTYTTLLTTTKMRSNSWTSYDFDVTAPMAGCSLQIVLTSGHQGPSGSIIDFDDVELSRADPVGPSTTPAYDLRVDRTPSNTLTLTGAGSATLQAHADGRWQTIGELTLSDGVPSFLTVPERHTGRNLHYGYHEGHVSELMYLHGLTGDPMFLDFARRWAPFAPLYNGTVPMNDARTINVPPVEDMIVPEILPDPAVGDALESLEGSD